MGRVGAALGQGRDLGTVHTGRRPCLGQGGSAAASTTLFRSPPKKSGPSAGSGTARNAACLTGKQQEERLHTLACPGVGKIAGR
jgi:hypothetical protein